MDNRLDFINKFQPEAVDKMTAIRHLYIELDKVLRNLAVPFFDAEHANNYPAPIMRCLALARTNLETSLQYAIKSVCLKYESKG